MSTDQRKKTTTTFRKNDLVKVLVCSLKCGGTSLTLIAANRVILVDPYYNKAIEEQAFGRVKRIGQKKEMHLVRMIVNGNTVDRRVVEMQNRKKDEISDAMLEYDSKTAISRAEGYKLVGYTRDGDGDDDEDSEGDDDGKFIVMDDDDDDDRAWLPSSR